MNELHELTVSKEFYSGEILYLLINQYSIHLIVMIKLLDEEDRRKNSQQMI